MPKNIELFEFHYINGDTHMELPTIRDVVLTKKAQAVCQETINKAKRLPPRIRNDAERELYLGVLGDLREIHVNLDNSWKLAREPYVRVSKMIETAIWPLRMELEKMTAALKVEIGRFEEERRRGAQEERERLEKKAQEEELKARYADNPVTKRQAKNRALEYEKAAKEATAKPVPGIATHVYWEPVLQDPLIVLKTHAEFLDISVDEDAVRKHIKDLEERGEKIKENSIPGIRLVKHSDVTYRR